MPRKRNQTAETPQRDISELDEKPIRLKDDEDESEDDPSPKKVASDDDEAEVEGAADDLLGEDEESGEDDDPIKDFLTEEDNW